MSNLYTVPYSTFMKRLDDWLRENGGSVVDLPLDLLNRAIDRLMLYKDWEGLIVRYPLTITSQVAALPANFSREVRVWHDSNSDGKGDYYYYAHANHDDGYFKNDAFTMAAGHVNTLTFYRDPPHTVTCEYIRALDHFTGNDDGQAANYEYSYFPSDLVVRTAQMIHTEEADIAEPEVNVITNARAVLLKEYESTHQYRNRDFRHEVNDFAGDDVENTQYNLAGDGDRWNGGYDNSYDYGLN